MLIEGKCFERLAGPVGGGGWGGGGGGGVGGGGWGDSWVRRSSRVCRKKKNEIKLELYCIPYR